MLTLTLGILAAAFVFYIISDQVSVHGDPYLMGHDGYTSRRNYDPWDRYYPTNFDRRPHYEDYRREEDHRLDELRRYERQRRRDDFEANVMTLVMVVVVVAAYLAYLHFGGK